ncbi:MAG: hypothetical protein R2876_05400 [Eubacteriales bacterium]
MSETKNNSGFFIKLISGGYSSDLWDALIDCCESESSPYAFFDALYCLHKSKDDEPALNLLLALYDIAGTVVPPAIKEIYRNSDMQGKYLDNLLSDIESIL